LLILVTAILPLAAAETRSWTVVDLTRSSLGTVLGQRLGKRPDRILSRDHAGLLGNDAQNILNSPLPGGPHDLLLSGGSASLAASSNFGGGRTNASQATIASGLAAYMKNAPHPGTQSSFPLHDQWWVQGLFSAPASGRGYSLIGRNSPYAGDVFGGAITREAGGLTIANHDRPDGTRLSLGSYFDGLVGGFALSRHF
jgi:hypothetical protein